MSTISFSNIQVHIIYLGERQHDEPKLITDLHHDMLAKVVGRYDINQGGEKGVNLLVENTIKSDLKCFFF